MTKRQLVKWLEAKQSDAKLRNRYPNGFEAERSLHRQEGDV